MMNIGRREQIDESEDAAPVEMLAQLFEAHGWPCEFVNDDEIFVPNEVLEQAADAMLDELDRVQAALRPLRVPAVA